MYIDKDDLITHFFSVFGIETECHNPIVKLSKDKKCEGICKNCEQYNYPKITAEKLLQMICIWNYTMPCIDDCIIPIDYLGLKSVVLDKIIRYSEIEYEFDVDALKYQIQQLFKEEA